MVTPYEIDHKMSKENSERVARQVDKYRAHPKNQDEKAAGGLLPMVAATLSMVVAFVRGA
jgi:hypothetical protein